MFMEKNSADMKIWGMSYGVLGDLIMGLPMLNYFEKKYPGSYKFWVIEKKCSVGAQLYFNHPLIDRIKITDERNGFGRIDKQLMEKCDIIAECPPAGKRGRHDWYNYESCVEHTAILGGIEDIKEVLTEDEMKPKLYKWFDAGAPQVTSTYAKKANISDIIYDNNIAIWPFAGSAHRSPSAHWWNVLIDGLILKGYTVSHYGMPWDPNLSNLKGYQTFPDLSYFDQVRSALASRLVIGTDSGAMWVMGAYSHPAINLLTNWLPDHKSNLLALAPVNDNGQTFHEMGSCDNISIRQVTNNIMERVPL
jgi:ADP-heptose:LPS heptosyltransferase|tara:strand:+ start:476 stop:1393 length:918 start_codon:yes stop_codon:yes gene_type:complete